MEYKASFDWVVKSITAFVSILFTSIIAFYLSRLVTSTDAIPTLFTFGFTAFLLTGIYTVCYLYRPLKYVIDSDKIIIKRPYKDKVIALAAVKDVYAINDETMGLVWRTFGNGGLFGFYGAFRSDRYGAMSWYATRKSNYVMLETHDAQKIVLTPDDLDMVNEIKKRIGH